jgi:hypothetical protein
LTAHQKDEKGNGGPQKLLTEWNLKRARREDDRVRLGCLIRIGLAIVIVVHSIKSTRMLEIRITTLNAGLHNVLNAIGDGRSYTIQDGNLSPHNAPKILLSF